MPRSHVALPYRTSARCRSDAPDPEVTRFGATVRRARRARQALAVGVVALAFALCFIPLAAPQGGVRAVSVPTPGPLRVRVVLPGPWLCPVYPGDPSGEREKAILSARDLYGIDCSQGPWY